MRKKLLLASALLAASICPALPQAGMSGFSPCAGGTLAVSNTSANVQLSSCGPVTILYNISAQEAFYTIGSTSAATATAQSSSTAAPAANTYSLPGNSYVVLNVNTQTPYLAAITATSTTTIRIVQGYGNT